uniref:Uncharacterized protein n=1 Tax=Oryza glumipatula TaxID=40148 RepID=A0A0D9Z4V2_9ORYZ
MEENRRIQSKEDKSGTSDPEATKQKGLRTLFLLIAWEIWKERIARIFRAKKATGNRWSSRLKSGAITTIKYKHHKPSKKDDKYRANLALVSRRLAIRQHHLDLMGTEEYSFTLSSTQTSEQVSKAVTHFTSPRLKGPARGRHHRTRPAIEKKAGLILASLQFTTA